VRVTTLAAFGVTAAIAAVLASISHPVQAQSRRTSIVATDAATLRAWTPSLDRMIRDGELRVRREDPDTLVPGRIHERLSQYYKGVPLRGADVTRQTERGITVSIFGTMYTDLDLDVTPKLGADEAAAIVTRESGSELGPSRLPTLMVLPDAGTYRLVYRAVAFSSGGGFEYFLDASSGAIVLRLDALQRQSAIGSGSGVLGDTKKLSVTRTSGVFVTDDALRPPALITFDMRGNLRRTLDFLNGVTFLTVADRGTDTDNVWSDLAAVDAHAYGGYVYDYFFKRFGRRGLDNDNFPMLSLVHTVARDSVLSQYPSTVEVFYLNAFYAGDGIMVYGEGLPPNITLAGQRWNYLSGGLDVVAHELTHGVTEFTSSLVYENESGALNESFSDMMGTAVEFFYQPAGGGPLKADYLIGEDVITPGGIRSMENPAAYGQPDHYARRAIVPLSEDNGGVHVNCGIGNQAYYLAIEGGTNRTSGLSVRGVGQANRDQIEKVMYRGFTQMMPANATYSVARAVTIQASRDLYGAGSAAERAVTEAWAAVGVN
jgi:bacillolysin